MACDIGFLGSEFSYKYFIICYYSKEWPEGVTMGLVNKSSEKISIRWEGLS